MAGAASAAGAAAELLLLWLPLLWLPLLCELLWWWPELLCELLCAGVVPAAGASAAKAGAAIRATATAGTRILNIDVISRCVKVIDSAGCLTGSYASATLISRAGSPVPRRAYYEVKERDRTPYDCKVMWPCSALYPIDNKG